MSKTAGRLNDGVSVWVCLPRTTDVEIFLSQDYPGPTYCDKQRRKRGTTTTTTTTTTTMRKILSTTATIVSKNKNRTMVLNDRIGVGPRGTSRHRTNLPKIPEASSTTTRNHNQLLSASSSNHLVQPFHPPAAERPTDRPNQSCLQSAIKSVGLYLRLPKFCQGEMQ